MAASGLKQRRTKSAEATRANIIDVATSEFATKGYSGARVDEIAERTRTSKRMIYYYFGSKEGLYREVLFSYYSKLRSQENALDLGHKEPFQALEELVDFTFSYHADNAEIVRLVMVENIHRGKHIEQMPEVSSLNSSIISTVENILQRGAVARTMRTDVDAFELYISIAALCFFNVSNRYTIRAIFSRDIAGDCAEDRRRTIREMVRRMVAA